MADENHAVATITEGPGALLSAIVHLAKDPVVDVHKLDALLKMQERMEERAAQREFSAAFSRLSSRLPRVKKNGTIDLGVDRQNGRHRGTMAFAKWEDIDAVIRPLMSEEGFTLSFDSTPKSGDGGGLIVTGTLAHRDGHSRTASIPLALDSGAGRNNLQAMGSSLSYGKRYCAEMLLNIVREGDDDDGVLGGMKRITPEQVNQIEELIKETRSDRGAFLQHFGLADVANMEDKSYVPAMTMLNAKKARQGKKAPPQQGTE